MVPRLLSIREASRYSGLSIWFLRERIWRGELRVFQAGVRKQMVLTADLEQFIDDRLERRGEPQSAPSCARRAKLSPSRGRSKERHKDA
jgi:hypothetical protein